MSFFKGSCDLLFAMTASLLLVGCGTSQGVAGPLLNSTVRAYVANTGDSTISSFRIDTKSLNPVSLADISLPDPPSSLAIDRQGRFLFAGSASTGSIMTIAINAEVGSLTYLSKLSIGSGFRKLIAHPRLNGFYALDQANTGNLKFFTYPD